MYYDDRNPEHKTNVLDIMIIGVLVLALILTLLSF